MIVKCEKCEAGYNLDDRHIRPDGSNVRCFRCRHVFKVYSPDPEKIKQSPEKYPETKQVKKNKLSGPEAKRKKPERKKDTKSRKKYTPFKTKLIHFAAILIGFIAVIVIPIEAYQPWQKLFQLIDNSKNLIGGTESAFDEGELERINRFAMGTINNAGNIFINDDKNSNYFYLSFNMLVTDGKVLPKDHLEKMKIPGFEDDFDYEKLNETRHYWRMRFADDPGVFEIFRKYKRILMNAYENAQDIGTLYIMIDSGKKQGFFEESIAYVLDGYDWRNDISSYVGEPYLTENNEFWRKLALSGKEGYGTNPIFDREKWFLPRFDKDDYGSWFSVWLTKKVGGVYNVFCIDFEASSVEQLMIQVGTIVIIVVIFLAIMVALIARWLSRLVTRPITELTRGAGEVARGNYDYQVPILKEDEFGELTNQFNKMTLGQKERLNLMETLEKFLSKELAEMAAEKGIVLGGQKSDCTVMFTDFAGFSTITQKMTASESVEVLNLYFDAMIQIIKSHGGFPDKYIGDAIVALFGAPVPVEDHAERAVSCAIKMQQKMREINDKRRKQVCFAITDESLVYLKAKGVDDDFVEKLETIKKQTLSEYLKFRNISDDSLKKLETIKKEEFIGKGEFLEGEFLDIVLGVLCDEEHAGNYKSLLLNYAEKQKRALFEMRIGLNSGEVIAGAIGCDAKLEYTSIGETTNLANRMEAACEIGHVAIAKETYMRIRHIFFKGINISATPDIVTVKGMGDVPVYRIYVNNLKISKDMSMKDDIKKFYVYEDADHELRESPDDVSGVTFTSIAKYL